MPDYRTMYDANWLYAFDLKGKDVTLTIAEVEGVEVENQQQKKSKKPRVLFRELLKRNPPDKRGLLLNKTNGKTIAKLYGNETDAWVGKRVTLYPTTTQFGRDNVECIRVRPIVPKAGGGAEVAAPVQAPEPEAPELASDHEPHEREPGEEG
jgi:hypothetical protein